MCIEGCLGGFFISLKNYKLFCHFITMYIKTIPEKCCGCLVCESVCSLWNRNVINKYKSGIRVDKKNIVEDIQTACSHGHLCDFECIEACKFDAMKKENNIVFVDHDNCVGCKACEKACPLHASWIHNKKAYKCNLCGGKEPQCVKFCSQNALEIEVE